MSLRDAEFRENLDGFIATSILEKDPLLPPEKVGCRYADLRFFADIISDRGCAWASCSKAYVRVSE
jgi:hypothetical protein